MYADVIEPYIQENTQLLDLGCGDGSLLKTLVERKQITGYGLEIDSEQISQCISHGINVIEQDINRGLANFSDKSFDTVLMAQALQIMKRPDQVLEEMLRVGKECIVTFPNFGLWKARYSLLLNGRMPVSKELPFEWYDTPNIHFCTFRDFEVLCAERNITILDRTVVSQSPINRAMSRLHPNLFGETAIYHLTRR